MRVRKINDGLPSPDALDEARSPEREEEASHRRPTLGRREALLAEIVRLADVALAGTISESLRTCGNPACRCRTGGPKHGPYGYVSYRKVDGGTARHYVVNGTHEEVRRRLAAARTLQELLRELMEMNREDLLARAKGMKQER